MKLQNVAHVYDSTWGKGKAMIKSKKPTVKIEGSGEELLNDIANIARTLVQSLGKDFGNDAAKALVLHSVEMGIERAEGKAQSEKPKEYEQPELKEIEKAFDEFLDKCLDSVLGKD